MTNQEKLQEFCKDNEIKFHHKAGEEKLIEIISEWAGDKKDEVLASIELEKEQPKGKKYIADGTIREGGKIYLPNEEYTGKNAAKFLEQGYLKEV